MKKSLIQKLIFCAPTALQLLWLFFEAVGISLFYLQSNSDQM